MVAFLRDSAITRRAAPEDDSVDLREQRILARERAAAAELVAEEANAARLRALLDAAREQNERKTIQSAEQRFDEAKGNWEAARDSFLEHQDRYNKLASSTRTGPLKRDRMSLLAWLTRGATISPQRALLLGVLMALLLVMSVGATGYLLLSDTPPAREASQSAGFSHDQPKSQENIERGNYSALGPESTRASTSGANAEASIGSKANGKAPARPKAKPRVQKRTRAAATTKQRPRTESLEPNSRLPATGARLAHSPAAGTGITTAEEVE